MISKFKIHRKVINIDKKHQEYWQLFNNLYKGLKKHLDLHQKKSKNKIKLNKKVDVNPILIYLFNNIVNN